ncbi:MAG: TRAP transporter small permease [Clostridia bacterium]|nr:TRAP transporter small permease [Clostridia bacterium]
MKNIDKTIDTIMKAVMAAAMFSLVVGGTWQIFTRWILKDPSTFTEEFMRYMLIWASMIGSAYCFYKDKHLTLDLFKKKATGKKEKVLMVFIESMILFFVIYVFVYGGSKMAFNATNTSSVMQIPFKYLYMILPISGIFIVLARALKYYQAFLMSRKSKEEN